MKKGFSCYATPEEQVRGLAFVIDKTTPYAFKQALQRLVEAGLMSRSKAHELTKRARHLQRANQK